VKVVATVTDAEKELRGSKFDLLLLDVMIPSVGPEEEERYQPAVTELGTKTGYLFYLTNKELLEKSGMRVLVMTVRLDKTIMDEFVKAGLPRHNFATKYDLRDANDFLSKIQKLLSEPQPAAA
jgi:hypothetical protein